MAFAGFIFARHYFSDWLNKRLIVRGMANLRPWEICEGATTAPEQRRFLCGFVCLVNDGLFTRHRRRAARGQCLVVSCLGDKYGVQDAEINGKGDGCRCQLGEESAWR